MDKITLHSHDAGAIHNVERFLRLFGYSDLAAYAAINAGERLAVELAADSSHSADRVKALVVLAIADYRARSTDIAGQALASCGASLPANAMARFGGRYDAVRRRWVFGDGSAVEECVVVGGVRLGLFEDTARTLYGSF